MGLAILIPVSLAMGLCGLAAFFWALRSGQYDDLDGAGWRILTRYRPGAGAGAGKAEADAEPGAGPEDRNAGPGP